MAWTEAWREEFTAGLGGMSQYNGDPGIFNGDYTVDFAGGRLHYTIPLGAGCNIATNPGGLVHWYRALPNLPGSTQERFTVKLYRTSGDSTTAGIGLVSLAPGNSIDYFFGLVRHLFQTPTPRILFEWSQAGVGDWTYAITDAAPPDPAPIYLRLTWTKAGDIVEAEHSADGVVWSALGGAEAAFFTPTHIALIGGRVGSVAIEIAYDDLIAETDAVPAETDPPVVTPVSPVNGEAGVALNANVTLEVTDVGSGLNAATVDIKLRRGPGAWEQVWLLDLPSAGYAVVKTAIAGGFRYEINPAVDFGTCTTISIRVQASDVAGNPVDTTYSFSTDFPVRTPSAGLYTDDIRPETSLSTILVINAVPEDGETGVPYNDLVRLHVIAPGATGLKNNVKVYLTKASDGVKRLAYDQAAGGFQPGFDGAKSVATYQASPGSAVNDELWLIIQHADWPSLDIITVEVEAEAN